MFTLADLFTLRPGQRLSKNDVDALKQSSELTQLTNATTIAFTPAHAQQRIASIIDAAAMQLFKSEAALHVFAALFARITQKFRDKGGPILTNKLTKLVNSALPDDDNKVRILEQLDKLTIIWEHYNSLVNDICDKHLDDIQRIKHVKAITRNLIKYLMSLKLMKPEGVAGVENEKNQMLGRGNFYRPYQHHEQTFIHLHIPYDNLTEEQFRRELTNYPYLSKLDEATKRQVIAHARPCYQKDRTGLANCALDITAYETAEGEWQISSVTTQHSSFVPAIKDEQLRRQITEENFRQWLVQAAQLYLNIHPCENINDYQNKESALPIELSTISVQTPVPEWLTRVADAHQNQLLQITEVFELVQAYDQRPLKISFDVKGEAITLFVKPNIIFMEMPINQGRFAVSGIVKEINDRGFPLLEKKVKKFLTENKDSPNYEAIIDLFTLAKFLIENDKENKSETYNHHFPAIYLLINELIGIPSEVWCIDTKDRSMIIKTLAEAYRQYRRIFNRFPNLKNLKDVADLQEIEVQVYLSSDYRIVADHNGYPGMRRYSENKKVVKFLAKYIGGYDEGELDDRNKHLPGCDVGKAMSELNYYQENYDYFIKHQASKKLPTLTFNTFFNAKTRPVIFTGMQNKQLPSIQFRQKLLYNNEQLGTCSYMMLGTSKKAVMKLLLANLGNKAIRDLIELEPTFQRDNVETIDRLDVIDLMKAYILKLDAKRIPLNIVQAYAIAAGCGFRQWDVISTDSNQLSLVLEKPRTSATTATIDILDLDGEGKYVCLQAQQVESQATKPVFNIFKRR